MRRPVQRHLGQDGSVGDNLLGQLRVLRWIQVEQAAAEHRDGTPPAARAARWLAASAPRAKPETTQKPACTKPRANCWATCMP